MKRFGYSRRHINRLVLKRVNAAVVSSSSDSDSENIDDQEQSANTNNINANFHNETRVYNY